jgi:hypothetical protein
MVKPGAENLAPTGIRTLDRPARSELLYRLCYPSPQQLFVKFIKHLLVFTVYLRAKSELITSELK